MEPFSPLLVLCEGNSPVTGEFPSQWPVPRSFGVSFDLRLNNRLSKPLRRRWFDVTVMADNVTTCVTASSVVPPYNSMVTPELVYLMSQAGGTSKLTQLQSYPKANRTVHVPNSPEMNRLDHRFKSQLLMVFRPALIPYKFLIWQQHESDPRDQQ